jgi:hypothetical protein
MVTVFDRFLAMKDREGTPSVDETVEKLDEMLNAYNVKHSFTLPHNAVIAEYPAAVITLNYNDADDLVLSLIYALFCKVYRGAGDKELGEALAKTIIRYLGKEKKDETDIQ